MAEGDHKPFKTDYSFTNVQLFKDDSLGSGSFGVVCKAKCDQLVCAAKLLHPVLFQTQDSHTGVEKELSSQFASKFGFLCRISHPNIVQYLGIYCDPKTNAPVLLMELMDKSLTHYLELSPEDIPYHIQVNLASDIAQALAFLHANRIIHRDLSSNNVLLIGDSRAKVSDFGMSRFTNTSNGHIATLTIYPGTLAFMSPEALDEAPVYTEKLDTFSFGVLLIQILTRQSPQPMQQIRIKDRSEKMSVSEIERRKDHIDLIEPTHPLLSIALDCLKDQPTDRPSSQKLCEELQLLKSSQKDDSNNDTMQDNSDQQLQVDLELQVLQEELQSVKQQLKQLHQQLEIEEEIIELKRNGIVEPTIELPTRSVQLETEMSLQFKWETLPDAPRTTTTGSSTTIGDNVYLRCVSYCYEFNSTNNRWRILPKHPNFEYTIINIEDTLTSIGGWFYNWNASQKKSNCLYCHINRQWVKRYPPMSTRRYAPAAVYSNFTLVVAGGTDNRNSNMVEVLNISRKQWSTVSSLPLGMKQPSMIISGEHIYIHNSYTSNSVLKCSLFSLVESRPNSSIWENIGSLPVTHSTLAKINGIPLAVGGKTSSNEYTKDILLYNPSSNSWTVVGQMSVPRSQCLTASLPGNKLIVVGGDTSRLKIEMASIV